MLGCENPLFSVFENKLHFFRIQIENKLLLPCHHHTSAKFTSKLQNSSLYNKHSRMHKYFVYLRKESVAHGSWPSLELLSYHLVDVLSTLYLIGKL